MSDCFAKDLQLAVGRGKDDGFFLYLDGVRNRTNSLFYAVEIMQQIYAIFRESRNTSIIYTVCLSTPKQMCNHFRNGLIIELSSSL